MVSGLRVEEMSLYTELERRETIVLAIRTIF